jgi:antitoxin component of RelBE/YafQ-DinJ toxin-antitoxin module
MAKDTPLAFRITSNLKRKLQEIADEEGRSVSQICDIFLWASVDSYEVSGSEFIRKTMLRHRSS